MMEMKYDDLPELWRNLISNYYEQVIEPQKDRQQIRFDGVIHEDLPQEIVCPRCSSPATQVITKRGIHFKCKNVDCGWDSNRIFDFLDRDHKIKQCAEELKKMFPKLNFVLNTNYSPDSFLTGKLADRSKNYDLKCYWMGNIIARIRIEVNKNIDADRFMKTEECYVVGRPEVIDYLSKSNKDGLIVHYLVDEKKYRIAMSRIKSIKENCSLTEDRFKNKQYHISTKFRPLIITFDLKEMEDLLFKGFQRILYREAQIW